MGGARVQRPVCVRTRVGRAVGRRQVGAGAPGPRAEAPLALAAVDALKESCRKQVGAVNQPILKYYEKQSGYSGQISFNTQCKLTANILNKQTFNEK